MQIIILAAGIGSRLGNPFPKPLTPLKNGKSIMQMQIENISSKFDPHSISTVVGFKKNLIMEEFPDVSYIYNPVFDSTNTSKSLLRALRKHKDTSVLWFNGDVVFDVALLDSLTSYIDANQSFVAVNTSSVAEEEVKYTLKEGYIDELSKTVKNGLGEAVGINFISSNDIGAFINRLEECGLQDYFEKGLEMAIEKDGIKVQAVDISKHACMEIDFLDDLKTANETFHS